MKKRLLLILLIIAALLTGACDTDVRTDSGLDTFGTGETEDISLPAPKNVKLMYYAHGDQNPITTTQRANHELLKLVYSPLIRMDSTFKPVCILAESFETTASEVVVTLRTGLTFADGSAVRATDAVESLRAAKKNESSPYHKQLAAFSKFTAQKDNVLVATLAYSDVDAAALLDVPIMKNGKEYIGCGPYVFDTQYGDPVLAVREDYFSPASISLIKLIEPADDTAAQNMFSLGGLDMLPSNDSMDFSFATTRDYELISYPSSGFVFIGINCLDEKLADAAVRRALSQAVDREKIVSSTMIGRANGTIWPFSPLWYRMEGTASVLSQSTDAKISGMQLELLVAAGSNVKAEIAQAIAQSFAAAGVTLTVTPLEAEAFDARIAAGEYELYLGETHLARDMDSTYLFETGGIGNKHGFENESLDNDYNRYKRGDITLSEYLIGWDRQTPLIPIMFNKSTLFAAKGITGFKDQTPWAMYGNATAIKITNNS